MRILLYKPNDLMTVEENSTHNPSGTRHRALPYSLAVVAATLRNAGFEVFVLDAGAEQLSIDKVKKRMLSLGPNVIAIATSALCIDLDFKGIKEVKEKTGAKIVSLLNLYFEKEAMERYREIDALVRHEWNPVMVDLVKAWDENLLLAEIKGIYYRDREEIKYTGKREHAHIKDLPFPALDLFPMKKYTMYQIVVSDGCPHRCLFCFFGWYPASGWEAKSLDRVMMELRAMRSYGNKFILFTDNEVSAMPEFMKDLCRRIIKEDLDIVWDANTRATSIDEELARLFAKSGGLVLGYGAETFIEEISKLNNKGFLQNESHIKRCIELLNKYDIYAQGYFLFGLRGDTRETIRHNFEHIQKMGIYDASFELTIPYPETGFYRYLKHFGYLEEFTIDNLIWIKKNMYHYPQLQHLEGKKPDWRIEHLTFDDLLEIHNDLYYKMCHGSDRIKFWYLLKRRPKFLLRQIVHIFDNPIPTLKRVWNVVSGG